MKTTLYPPGPKPQTPFEMVRSIRRDLLAFLKQTADQYGDIAYFKAGPQQVLLLHHHARYFPEPEKFDPERWTPEAEAQRPKFSYLPFGADPRVCIGESFAWMESVLVLATLAQQWQMRLVPGHPIALQPMITLRPKHGMRMKLRNRKTV